MDTQSNSDGEKTRSQPETLRGRALRASFSVNDLEKSLAWYTDVLGFTVNQQHEREGQVVAVSLKAGVVEIVLGRDNGAKGVDRVKGQGCSFMITTAQDIDEIAARVIAAGGTLETEPADTGWGTRVFRVKDPDGFTFVISS